MNPRCPLLGVKRTSRTPRRGVCCLLMTQSGHGPDRNPAVQRLAAAPHQPRTVGDRAMMSEARKTATRAISSGCPMHRFPAQIPERFDGLAAEIVALKADALVTINLPDALAAVQTSATARIHSGMSLVHSGIRHSCHSRTRHSRTRHSHTRHSRTRHSAIGTDAGDSARSGQPRGRSLRRRDCSLALPMPAWT